MTTDYLRAFVRESNKIEGIVRAPTKAEIEAHETFINLKTVTVEDVSAFVLVVAKRPLRDRAGMDVRVGNHLPPEGGPFVPIQLQIILHNANTSDITPYETHRRYETLHPYMDGNGRSGRILWLWQMIREGRDLYVLDRGFLHTWYYQSLSAGR